MREREVFFLFFFIIRRKNSPLNNFSFFFAQKLTNDKQTHFLRVDENNNNNNNNDDDDDDDARRRRRRRTRRRREVVAPPGPANPDVRVDPDNGRHVLRRGDTTQRVEDVPKQRQENRVRRVARSAGGGESDENIPKLRIPDDERVRETEGVFLRRKDWGVFTRE